MTATLPSLDAIQARADAARLCDRPDCDLRKCQDQRDNAAMLAALRAVLARHEPYTIWAYDDVTGAWIYDENDEQVVVAVACRECTPDASIESLGDCEWTEDDPIVVHPCPTVRAVTAHIENTPKEKP